MELYRSAGSVRNESRTRNDDVIRDSLGGTTRIGPNDRLERPVQRPPFCFSGWGKGGVYRGRDRRERGTRRLSNSLLASRRERRSKKRAAAGLGFVCMWSWRQSDSWNLHWLQTAFQSVLIPGRFSGKLWTGLTWVDGWVDRFWDPAYISLQKSDFGLPKIRY